MSKQLTREQAVAIVGEEAVASAEAKNADINGRQRDDDMVVFTGSIVSEDANGYDAVLTVFYEPMDRQLVDRTEDASDLPFAISHYEVV